MSTIIYTITEIYDKLQKLPQKIEKQLFPEEFKKEITITGIIKSIRDYYNNKYIILYNKNNKLTCFCNKSLNEIIKCFLLLSILFAEVTPTPGIFNKSL